jgi:hypothetical protein
LAIACAGSVFIPEIATALGDAVLQATQNPFQKFWAYWHQHRYSFLFYTLCCTLIAFPLLSMVKYDQTLLIGFVAVNMVAALGGLKNRLLSHLLLLILLIVFGVRIVAGAIDFHAIVGVTTVLLIALGFFACIDTVRVAMSTSEVNGELLYAALSVYMLIGILFGIVHYLIGLEWADAYTLPAGEAFSLRTSIYFSFVTQTTLGYGDVLPRSELARGLTIVQGITGQLYLAVMVARLVGLYASATRMTSPNGCDETLMEPAKHSPPSMNPPSE